MALPKTQQVLYVNLDHSHFKFTYASVKKHTLETVREFFNKNHYEPSFSPVDDDDHITDEELMSSKDATDMMEYFQMFLRDVDAAFASALDTEGVVIIDPTSTEVEVPPAVTDVPDVAASEPAQSIVEFVSAPYLDAFHKVWPSDGGPIPVDMFSKVFNKQSIIVHKFLLDMFAIQIHTAFPPESEEHRMLMTYQDLLSAAAPFEDSAPFRFQEFPPIYKGFGKKNKEEDETDDNASKKRKM